jgi:hypothetical protein
MSQSTLPEQLPPTPAREDARGDHSRPLPVSVDLEPYELDYQPMPLSAPVALFLGIAAFSGLMGLFGLALAAVGILVSIGSYLQIRASQGRLSGTKMAVGGGVLSILFLGAGSYLMISDYKNELPPGYQRVNFPKEIAEKGFVVQDGHMDLHPDVKPLVDQPLFLKGYMWQQGTYESSFVLLKDNGKCCFGGNPAPNDMIYVRLEENQTFRPMTGLVSVAGVFRANPNAPLGEPVYVMDAKLVEQAKTVF